LENFPSKVGQIRNIGNAVKLPDVQTPVSDVDHIRCQASTYQEDIKKITQGKKMDVMVAFYQENHQPVPRYESIYNKSPQEVNKLTTDQVLTFRLDLAGGTLTEGFKRDEGKSNF
jgi:hypothetical protein